jgi:hypothetical protein
MGVRMQDHLHCPRANLRRRRLLLAATALSASGVGLAACGGSGGGTEVASAVEAWSVTPAPVLIAENFAVRYDLRWSLPARVRRGGRFAVHPGGAGLPRGVVLSPEGVLTLTSEASVGTTSGIVFSYEEPPS